MSRVTTFSTTFSGGAENPISEGGVWSSGYTGIGNIRIVGTVAYGNTSGSDNWSSVNTPSFANNQWCQATIGSAAVGATLSEYGCNLRVGAPAPWTGYTCLATYNEANSSVIGVLVAGVFTSLKTDNSVSWANGDVVSAEAEGTTLRIFRNGALITSVTDGTLASGRIALGSYNDTLSSNTPFTAFSGGDLVADVTFVPPMTFYQPRSLPRGVAQRVQFQYTFGVEITVVVPVMSWTGNTLFDSRPRGLPRSQAAITSGATPVQVQTPPAATPLSWWGNTSAWLPIRKPRSLNLLPAYQALDRDIVPPLVWLPAGLPVLRRALLRSAAQQATSFSGQVVAPPAVPPLSWLPIMPDRLRQIRSLAAVLSAVTWAPTPILPIARFRKTLYWWRAGRRDEEIP